MIKPHWVFRQGWWYKFNDREHHSTFVIQATVWRVTGNEMTVNDPFHFKPRNCKNFVQAGYKRLTVKCSKCSNVSVTTCDKTPSGGWGSLKCGEPLCKSCTCQCNTVTCF